ncbi:Holliday junction branch migration DNA helicase RuvB [bacterium]|nr:Holliday junction branch migration DNA helicase RuvB [bacterium]
MEVKIEQEDGIEKRIRPSYLNEFVGQEEVRSRLQILIDAAKARGDALSHVLFHGPPGLGKTTLSLILAKEMNSSITQTSGPAIEKPADLAGLLTALEEGDILFIDEIHRLPKNVEEYLYQAMEDFTLDIMIDSGTTARSVSISLKPFTLVGATTKTGLLSSPLRTRFPFNVRMDFYDDTSLTNIALRSSKVMDVDLSKSGAKEIAIRSRGTPRIVNNHLKWVRDCHTHKSHSIEKKDVENALHMLAIDSKGLDEMDNKILRWIIDHHGGGPVGLKSIAIAMGEDPETIETVQEPYLVMQGYLKRGPSGREATNLAYNHLGLQKNRRS